MRQLWSVFLLVALFVVVLISAQHPASKTDDIDATPQRIISLAPSITEIVFALGLADKLVAVSDYCDYPAQANLLPKVGDLFAVNLAEIVRQQADLVILLESQLPIADQLAKLGINTLMVPSRSLLDLQHSITMIGEHTQHEANAQQLLATITSKINAIQQHLSESLIRPKVMVAMAHSLHNKQINTVYIAGNHDFYNDLITLAGGINVYQGQHFSVPTLSREGIIQLNPDIIIDVFPEPTSHNYDLQQLKQSWLSLDSVNAVKHQRIYTIEQGYATILGPRVVLLLEQLAQLIHPELAWEPGTS